MKPNPVKNVVVEKIEQKSKELSQFCFHNEKKLMASLAKAVLIAEINSIIDELEYMKPTAAFGDRFNVRIKELQLSLKELKETEV